MSADWKTHAESYDEMARALLNPAAPGLADERFAVHRNNVVVGLIETLGATYPAIRSLVGDEFFRAAAAEYVRQHPPQSPILMLYGDQFPVWIAGFPPAASVPYLGDVAALEWAWGQAYNAAEATPIAASALAGVTPDLLEEVCLTLHPSLRLLTSRYPVVSIWGDVTGRAKPANIDLSQGENALIIRPEAQVFVSAVPAPGFAFLKALADGQSLGTAAEAGATQASATQASATEQGFDLSAQISSLFSTGLVIGLELP